MEPKHIAKGQGARLERYLFFLSEFWGKLPKIAKILKIFRNFRSTAPLRSNFFHGDRSTAPLRSTEIFKDRSTAPLRSEDNSADFEPWLKGLIIGESCGRFDNK